MNRLIKACEVLDLNIISIQYNQFDDGPMSDISKPASCDEFVASKFAIEGMTCAACTSAIESAVLGLKGVDRISVSLPLARATVVHKPSQSTPMDIVAAIDGAGYGAKLGQRTAQENLELTQHSKELEHLRDAFSNATVLSSAVVTIEYLSTLSLFTDYQPQAQLTMMALGTYIQLIDASFVHEAAWSKGIRTMTMDTLISLSLLLGLALSFFNIALFGMAAAQTYFSSGAFLTVVIIGGRYLDHLLRRRSANSLAGLYRLQTESTTIRVRRRHTTLGSNDGKGGEPITTMTMPTAILRQQDEIIIPQSAIIPCDCYVIEGRSMIDQSTMTGESVPANKGPGEFLMSGTRNLSYELVAIVVKEQQDSALEQLVNSVSTATERQHQERGGDGVTSYFVSGVLCLTLVGFSWTLLHADNLSLSLRLNIACERAMAILASACPCALGLAGPSTVMAAIDIAWTRGVILKGGMATIEKLTKLNHIVMDKTGTLTTGRLEVAESTSKLEAWQCMLICAAERNDAQTHPVAQTVFQWALGKLNDEQKRQQNEFIVRNYRSELGKGVICNARYPSEVREYAVLIGTKSFLEENGIMMPERSICKRDMTSVHVALNGSHLTTLILRDTTRPEAPAVIAHLKSHFNLDITMLTGDVPTEAARVSEELDIPVLSSRTLPHEKASFIKDLKTKAGSRGGKVAMLGDGLNDTPALSTADVGIFLSPGMSTTTLSQSQPQSSTSSIVLTSPSLKRLPEVLEIAQKTETAAMWIRQWAVAYNVVAVALAMGVLEGWGVRVDAARAGTMMALSSVSVLAWGLWLRRELGKVKFEGV